MIKEYSQKLFVILKKNRQVVVTVLVLFVIVDILYLGQSSDLRIFISLFLYLLAMWFYKLESTLTFSISLFVFAIMSFQFLISGASESTEKAAVWLFFLILIGIFQQLRK